VLFGAFAGYTFWFPKAFGFRLEERLGRYAFWCWFVGFYLAFVPLYVLGLMGMTRRMQHYDIAEWHPWLLVAALGAAVILVGIGLMIAQLVVSFRHRDELRDVTGDPWNGRTLEWSTSSPPPAFNFAVLPRIEERDAYWTTKERALAQHVLGDEPRYHDIELPRSSATGVVCAFFATFLGFAMIWHIWWLAGVAFLGAFVTFDVFAWRDRTEYLIPAAEVARIDRENRSARRAALAQLGAAG
jgi:cytochrome o ubiquinol oxidase subunit 1